MDIPDAKTSLIQAEQLRLLIAGSPGAIAGNIALAALLAFAQKDDIDSGVILSWLTLIVAISVARTSLIFWYRRSTQTNEDSKIWLKRFRFSVAISGAGWGVAGWLLFPAEVLVHQTFLAFVLAGMSAGASASYAVDIVCVFSFLLLALAPFVLRLFIEGGEFSAIMGLAVMLFIGFMLTNMRNIYQRMLENIMLRIEAGEREQALRKSEAKYRELVENANSIILHWETSGKVTYFNEYAQQFFGFSADEIIGRNVIGTIVPVTDSVGNDLVQMVQNIWNDPRQFAHNENENMRKDGSRVWISWSNRAIMDSAGRCVEVLSIGSDITKLKQFEESLRRSKEQFEAILNATTESIFLVDCDGKILAINATAAQRLNKEPKELIGSNAFDIFPPETATRRRANLEEVCLTGKTKYDEDTRNDYLFALNYYPIHDENNKVQAVVVFAADITTRKKMEEALKESELRYRTVADFTFDWEYWIMPDGTFRYISPSCEQISGYTAKEFYADPQLLTRIIHPDDLILYGDHTHHLSAQGVPEPLDFRIRTKTGEYRWVSHVCRPVYDLAGQALGQRASNRDITERKQMEDQVRQLAFYDALTKLPNRRLLHDRLSQVMAASKRANRYGALMFLDLDNFKPLNDTHGHGVGDLLLIEVADRLKNCVREKDTVARLGGDEFVVMLSDLNEDKAESTSRAEIVAEKIRVALAEPYLLRVLPHEEKAETTVEHNCTASIGVVLFINHEASQDDILKWADMAMYQAKEAGRNLIRFYDQKT